MPGRNVTTDDYRFAYNGMEADNDVRGDGNSYTTQFRQYDPRLGRWLSLDPLMAMFPWMSPYVAFDDNPVLYVDPFGLEAGNGDPVKGGQPPTEPGTEFGQIKTGPDGNTYLWVEGCWQAGSSGGVCTPGEKSSYNHPGATPMEAALMALKAYENDLKAGDTQGLEGGWRVSSNVPEGVQLTSSEEPSGFQSVLYERMYKGEFEYAYVIRGTDEDIDWVHNGLQPFGGSGQYSLGVDNAEKIVNAFGSENVTIIGHSLGGGIATAAGASTGTNTIVFNPAWVSDATIDNLGISWSNSDVVQSYVVPGEILHTGQSAKPYIVGKELEAQTKLNMVQNTIFLGNEVRAIMAQCTLQGSNPVTLHEMSSVIQSLKNQNMITIKYGDYYESD